MLTKTFLIEGAQLVINAGYAQQSLIQRRMRVGFNTAGQILFGLEDIGVVAPSDGTSRSRLILVPAFDQDAISEAIDRAVAENRIHLDGEAASRATQ